MIWFTADVGTWDQGSFIRFREKSKHHALIRAHRIAIRQYNGDVVRLHICGKNRPKNQRDIGKLIWSEFNSWL